MELENLKIFVDVMNKGSFAAVARDRNLAPSSISRAISSLEDELGIRLLNRTTRRIKPTEAGQAYFQQVEAIVEELERARLMSVDLGQNPTGELRISASMTFGSLNVVPLLPEFMATYPNLKIYLDLSDSVVNLLDEGIDLAIRIGKVQDPGLVATRLTEMDYVVVASPEYLQTHGNPQQPGDLLSHECLLFPMAGLSTDWIFRDANGNTTRITPRSRLKITNALAHKQGALAHLGIIMLSRFSIWQELQSGKLVEVLEDYEATLIDFDNAVWLAYPSRKYLPSKVRVFIDFIKTRFDDVPWNRKITTDTN